MQAIYGSVTRPCRLSRLTFQCESNTIFLYDDQWPHSKGSTCFTRWLSKLTNFSLIRAQELLVRCLRLVLFKTSYDLFRFIILFSWNWWNLKWFRLCFTVVGLFSHLIFTINEYRPYGLWPWICVAANKWSIWCLYIGKP